MSDDFVPNLKPAAEQPASCCSARRPESPLVGFWARVMALAVDLGLLSLVLYFAANYSYDLLYSARGVTQPLAILFVFAYFWVGCGPATQGQTVGKRLASIRTVRRDGANLTWGQAAQRALLIQIMVFTYVSFLAPSFMPWLVLQRPTSLEGVLIFTTLSYLAIAYSLSNAVFCGLHPKKAAYHDLLAKTIVVRVGQEGAGAALASEWDDTCRIKLKLAKWPTGTVVVIFLVFLVQAWRVLYPEVDRDKEIRARISRDVNVKGFRFLGYDCPSPEKAREFDERLARIQKMRAEEHMPPLTTETLQTRPDGRKIHFIFLCEERASSATLIADPRYKDLIKRLPPLAEDLAKNFFPKKGDTATTYTHVQADFYEGLPLYLYARGRDVWAERIPRAMDDATTQTAPAER
jgi:uncharacterized RDD family membrane protein YckC